MKYQETVNGYFIRRPNRFIAQVLIGGREETVHVKNTGRCRELLLPGARVVLEPAMKPGRKTALSLVGVYKGERLINMDSQAPNQVVAEGLEAGLIQEIGEVETIRREVTFGASRFDVAYSAPGRRGFIEVKGVTLERSGIALFPDAPTARGVKHLQEMITAVQEGYEGVIFFLVQMKGIAAFSPNRLMDPDFSTALERAAQAGVRILAYDAWVSETEMLLGEAMKVQL